ncbi:uncharacterized protein LOC118735423 [Rhagoletis pomonella]|uniref:uncharacterized protein LOC118735423 n=1 Tax=Rhagoletis pomonella TaxID=28610 RepID=UPI0017805639|nr:uncharacterized protein LOC118735423 [Rhagoletis pomonella]
MASLNLRASAQSSIVRLGKITEAANFDPDPIECEVMLAQVNKHFERFAEYHADLVSLAQASELEARGGKGNSEPKPPVTSQQDMRLDPIKIPVFDGDPANWLSFKDLFESLVHNRTDLDSSYKLSKLRQHVNVDNVPLVGGLYTGGYEDMWKEMKRRYDNKRLLVESQVNRLLDLPNHPTESQKTLLRVVDTVQNAMRALAVIYLPVTQWDALTVPLLLPKLPTTTRYEWGMSLQTNNIPNLHDFITFIEKRANNLLQAASNVATTHRQPATWSVKAHVAAVNSYLSSRSRKAASISCPLCASSHRLHKCQRFLNLPVTERWDTVKRLSLCFNCLSVDHGARDCPSRDCTRCHHRHHTLLCREDDTVSAPAAEVTNTSVVPTRNSKPGISVEHTPQVYSRQQ